MRRLALAVVLASALAGCSEQKSAEIPPPQTLTASAVGHYCGMSVMEHTGPKAQIILASRPQQPVWFTSARDAFSFTFLPEEPKDVRAIYVSDMAKAPSWDKPGATNWVEAKQAFFVIGSRRKGGMGADETVPFSDRAAADKFAAENGGRVVTYAEVPRDYVLSAPEAPKADDESAHKHGHGGASSDHGAKHGH